MTDVVIEKFRGLNLVADPQEAGGETAVDLLDVAVDRVGRVRTRPGSVKFNTSASSGIYFGGLTAGNYGGTDMLVAINNGAGAEHTIDTFSTAGVRSAAVATFPVGWGSNNLDFANLGTATASYCYIASPEDTLQRFSGTALANSTGKPRLVEATPWGRLAQANYTQPTDSPSGADGSLHTVFFSSPLDPGTYDAADWVDLRPGDGEEIHALVSWGDMLFAFKQSAMFVFYGISTDSTGGAIFNYREVALTMGLATPGVFSRPLSAVAGPDGVYFVSPSGIYKTTGGPPVEVSARVRPIFAGSAASSLVRDADSRMQLTWVGERLFGLYENADGEFQALVWDRLVDEWSVWSRPGGVAGVQMTAWTGPSAIKEPALFYTQAVTNMNIYTLTEAATTDDGSAISWHWQSGFYDLGTPNSKRVGPLELWGIGTVTASVLTDHGTTDANAGPVTLGTSPAVAKGWHSKAYRGWLLSHKLSGTGSASVNRLSLTLRDQRLR